MEVYHLFYDLRQRINELETRLSLGSTVPPGSESALRENVSATDYWALRKYYISRLWVVVNHQADERVPEGKLRATFELTDQEYQALIHTALPTSGGDEPPLTSRAVSDSALREGLSEFVPGGSPRIVAHYAAGEPVPPAGGPPTPDLAASPDSNTEDLPEPDSPAGALFLQKQHTQEIGVYDYPSCVSCLRINYKLVFGEDVPFTDPQDMIQRMVAEIQRLRRLPK